MNELGVGSGMGGWWGGGCMESTVTVMEGLVPGGT